MTVDGGRFRVALRIVKPCLLVLLFLTLLACGSAEESPDIRQGRSVYGGLCGSCHGARGEGMGGPALDNLIENWPSCSSQISWIELGSEAWLIHEGATYGAEMKPVEGGMPGYADVLGHEEIQQIAAFTRAEYSGEDVEDALRSCGLDSAP